MGSGPIVRSGGFPLARPFSGWGCRGTEHHPPPPVLETRALCWVHGEFSVLGETEPGQREAGGWGRGTLLPLQASPMSPPCHGRCRQVVLLQPPAWGDGHLGPQACPAGRWPQCGASPAGGQGPLPACLPARDAVLSLAQRPCRVSAAWTPAAVGGSAARGLWRAHNRGLGGLAAAQAQRRESCAPSPITAPGIELSAPQGCRGLAFGAREPHCPWQVGRERQGDPGVRDHPAWFWKMK